MPFEWKDSFSIGLKTLDEQHKVLVGLIGELEVAGKSGKGQEVLGSVLKKLTQYAKVHFETEENLMLQSKYPEATEHTQQHKEFISKVSIFIRRFESKQTVPPVEVMKFLILWLTDHIDKVDRKLANSLLTGSKG